ncbi:MAG: hypothetical protein KA314_23610 [Chloroflexi bacterium]|nr:hypothetical protein [Chloroflexota bacterium]MBP8058832.1 hypothetical protein [Chloroflexota bacterium]
MIILRLLAFVGGSFLVLYTFLSAARTFVLPRNASVKLTWLVFIMVRRLFNWLMKGLRTYEQKDELMAMYAPVSLLLMVPVWLLVTTLGYAFMFWALGVEPLSRAFVLSGSSVLTLGFAQTDTLLQTILVFTEATIGLILVAMLISYLPTMYAAFSKREMAVSLLEVRAGLPPTAPELVWRLYGLNRDPEAFQAFWQSWESWFAEIEESHTSLAALVFFRSPRPHQSWVKAAGVVLDAAALYQSVAQNPPSLHPTLTIRAGVLALQRIAEMFRVPFNEDPHFPQDSIHISREEFDAAVDRLISQGVPVKSDRELAWRNFAGWRVNYDSVLLALSHLTMAPTAPWLSDFTFVPPDPSSGETAGKLKRIR